jgi:2-oxoglutarate/2-oxoacid ferredoxin oxidoreductase subunit alpha
MPEAAKKDRVNDFVIKLATVNGTGSASANALLMKAIFRMGVAAVGKNFFPSNIQGLPTWYEIRVTGDGYMARSGRVDLMVAMNAQTYAEDRNEVSPGGYLLYDSTWPRDKALRRDDITLLGVPLSHMCNEAFTSARARVLMKNVAYVGALAALLDLDMGVIRDLLQEAFGSKEDLMASNLQAIALGYDYAKEHFPCPLPIRIERMHKSDSHMMIDGNTAAALGCVYAGATFAAWYPITPSTSLMDAFTRFCHKYRVGADGKNNFCIVQAEDELAAIGMTLGANWAGARGFTSTSGPGISLMNEFLGFGYFTEIPAVLFDVQRTGPSTGMPTRTQQSDLLACAYASHGDTRHVLLFPANPEECFYFAIAAFDLAERLQTPVIVLSDLDIGMNDWMCPKLKWDPAYKPDRGKVLTQQELEKLPVFYRYQDKDGDGICYRTYPGVHAKGAYFTRGSGHNQYGGYTEDPQEYQQVLDRLLRKWETAAGLVPEPLITRKRGATSGIIAIGSSDGAVLEALDRLDEPMDYMRLRGFPFSQEVQKFLDAHEQVFVVDQNRDAQLKSLLLLETNVHKRKLISVLHYDGFPIACDNVLAGIDEAMQRVSAA